MSTIGIQNEVKPIIMKLARLMAPIMPTEPTYDPFTQITVAMGKGSSTSERSSSTHKTVLGSWGETDADRKKDD